MHEGFQFWCKVYSSKNSTVQCIKVPTYMSKVKKMRLAIQYSETKKCERKKLLKRDVGMVLSHEL